MAIDLSNIDKNKGTAGLLNALKKTSFAKADFSREDEWSVSKDKEGNGGAKIRFIISKDGFYFQEVRSHGYKNPATNRWYIENCPKTGQRWDSPCPSCDHANSLLAGRDYKKLTKDEQAKIKPFFASTSYWATILVEADPAVPENEGKIFKYRFGKKIMEKIIARLADDPLDGTPGVDVFDPIKGASFKLVVKKVAGYPNYDASSFADPKPLFGGDEKKINDMLENDGIDIGYMAEDEFIKDFDELSKKFYSVLGQDAPSAQTAEDLDQDEGLDNTTDSSYDDGLDDVPSDSSSDDGDEDIDYFQNLSSEDIG